MRRRTRAASSECDHLLVQDLLLSGMSVKTLLRTVCESPARGEDFFIRVLVGRLTSLERRRMSALLLKTVMSR
jgi:hypothetical protein